MCLRASDFSLRFNVPRMLDFVIHGGIAASMQQNDGNT